MQGIGLGQVWRVSHDTVRIRRHFSTNSLSLAFILAYTAFTWLFQMFFASFCHNTTVSWILLAAANSKKAANAQSCYIPITSLIHFPKGRLKRRISATDTVYAEMSGANNKKIEEQQNGREDWEKSWTQWPLKYAVCKMPSGYWRGPPLPNAPVLRLSLAQTQYAIYYIFNQV